MNEDAYLDDDISPWETDSDEYADEPEPWEWCESCGEPVIDYLGREVECECE